MPNDSPHPTPETSNLPPSSPEKQAVQGESSTAVNPRARAKPCGAKTRVGGSCSQPAMANGRCRMHGGKSLAGVASGTFKTGRYSKVLPTRLAQSVREAENDPELLSVRSEVALLHGRVSELVQRLYTGESGNLWNSLRTAWSSFEAANEAKDKDAIAASLHQLRNLIQQGTRDEESWAELVKTIDAKTKIAQAEWKRLVDLRQVLTAERATVFAVALLDAVLRHVQDPPQRRAIAIEFQHLMDAQPRHAHQVIEGENDRPDIIPGLPDQTRSTDGAESQVPHSLGGLADHP
jgi:hypothetical protein